MKKSTWEDRAGSQQGYPCVGMPTGGGGRAQAAPGARKERTSRGPDCSGWEKKVPQLRRPGQWSCRHCKLLTWYEDKTVFRPCCLRGGPCAQSPSPHVALAQWQKDPVRGDLTLFSLSGFQTPVSYCLTSILAERKWFSESMSSLPPRPSRPLPPWVSFLVFAASPTEPGEHSSAQIPAPRAGDLLSMQPARHSSVGFNRLAPWMLCRWSSWETWPPSLLRCWRVHAPFH